MENQEINNHQRGRGKNIFFAGLFLLIVLAIAGYALYAGKKETKPAIVTPETSLETENANWPREFFSYTGTVLEKKEWEIKISAPASKNYLREDTVITARLEQETVYTAVNIPEKIEGVEAGKPGKFFERQEITLDEIKIGEQITVFSGENVRDKREITAKKIEVTRR